MSIEELDEVVLTTEIPSVGLGKGQSGVVVHLHADGELCEVEFFDDTGSTIGVKTVSKRDLIPDPRRNLQRRR